MVLPEYKLNIVVFNFAHTYSALFEVSQIKSKIKNVGYPERHNVNDLIFASVILLAFWSDASVLSLSHAKHFPKLH